MKGLLLITIISLALSACPNSCSGHGTCVDNVCKCVEFNNEPQYTGNDCSLCINMFINFLVTCPSGFSWISSSKVKKEDGDQNIDPNTTESPTDETTTASASPRQLMEYERDLEATETGEVEEPTTTVPTTTPEPTTPLPDHTFNETAQANVTIQLPFDVFGGVLRCGKTTVNVIYYNATANVSIVAGLNDSEIDNINWGNCVVEMIRNDISMISVVKFHEYSGGDIKSDPWMTSEVYDNYEFNTTRLRLACIYQEKDPVEFIYAEAKSDNGEDGDFVHLVLDTTSVPTSCYVLAGKNGDEVKFEDSDAFQLFYLEKGFYYFGTKSTSKATFVAEKVTPEGELTFKKDSGMISFARNLIPGLEVLIYYIPISQGYVIIEKRIIKSIKVETTTTTTTPGGGSRLLADANNEQTLIVAFTEKLTEREGYSIRLVVNTNEGVHVATECSDNGVCDRTTGQCQCFPGFSGSACQILTNCPNNCNNNGRCVPYSKVLGEAKSEIAGIYSAGEGDIIFGCLCDPGHRGPDCSLVECPSSEDPQGATNVWTKDISSSQPYREPIATYEHRDCSGRGICNYDTGSCTCFDGFKGTACEEMSLSTM